MLYKLRFNLDKAFASTRYTINDLIWQNMASTVVFSKDSYSIASNDIYGSILFEDFDTNELKLNFYKTEIDIYQSHPPIVQYESP